jgi:transcriptional regulator with XRE-family HTH domain
MNAQISFGLLIKIFREQRGWPQEQLALITGLSDRTIQRIENNENSPSDTSIMALAHAFDTSFENMKELAQRPQIFEERVAEIWEVLNDADLLPRLSSGRDLARTMMNNELFHFEHEPLQDNQQADLIGGFIQEIKDYSDMWSDYEAIDRARAEVAFNERIQALDAYGFWVFGITRKEKLRFQAAEEPSSWNAGHLFIVRKNNPSLLKHKNGNDLLPTSLKSLNYKIDY